MSGKPCDGALPRCATGSLPMRQRSLPYFVAIGHEGSPVRDGAQRNRRHFSYIFERNRSAAVAERIEALTKLLEEFPFAGHTTDEPDVRVLSVVRYPFLTFYAIDETAEEVVILHVRHGAPQ